VEGEGGGCGFTGLGSYGQSGGEGQSYQGNQVRLYDGRDDDFAGLEAWMRGFDSDMVRYHLGRFDERKKRKKRDGRNALGT
jgi:hypothetical protein